MNQTYSQVRHSIEGTDVSGIFHHSLFPAGEHNIAVREWDFVGNIHDPIYFVVRSSGSLDMMEIGMKVDILRRKGYRNISLVLPYLAYSRQDRYTAPGYSFSLKVLANFINSLALNKVYSVDVHSDVAGIIDNFHNIPITSCIEKILEEKCGNIETVIAPDAGAGKTIYEQLQGTSFRGKVVICAKRRDVQTGNITGVVVPPVEGPALVVDDICDGGRTFIEIAKKLPTLEPVYLFVTHGIFSKSAIFQHYKEVWTTTSIDQDTPANVIDINFKQERNY